MKLCPNCKRPTSSGGPHRGAFRAMAGEDPRNIPNFGCGTISVSSEGRAHRNRTKRHRARQAQLQAGMPVRGIVVTGTGRLKKGEKKAKKG